MRVCALRAEGRSAGGRKRRGPSHADQLLLVGHLELVNREAVALGKFVKLDLHDASGLLRIAFALLLLLALERVIASLVVGAILDVAVLENLDEALVLFLDGLLKGSSLALLFIAELTFG